MDATARRPWTADGARKGAEESPLSETRAARRKPGSREGRQGRRHDTAAAEDEARRAGRRGRWPRMRRGPGVDLHGETATPRRSKSKGPLRGPDRTLSPMPSEQKGAYDGHLASSVLASGSVLCVVEGVRSVRGSPSIRTGVRGFCTQAYPDGCSRPQSMRSDHSGSRDEGRGNGWGG